MKRETSLRPFTQKYTTWEAAFPIERETETHPPPEENKRIFRVLRGEAPAAAESEPRESPHFHATFNVRSLRLFCSPFIKVRKA